ncbi:MAG TPA: two-component system sensor histidine kinase AtoS [Desulfotomaculum sp.]|nr:two-component system sensor histidine kinase AtoS [Desulfotomaculum sp.]
MIRTGRLGNLLLMAIALLLLFPVALTFYMVKIVNNSELALLENQKAKLARVLDDLDSSVNQSFEEILAARGARDAPRSEQARVLNEALRPPIEQLSLKYARVQMGFYYPALDLILDGSNGPPKEIPRRQKSAINEALSTRRQVMQSLGQGADAVLEVYRPYYRQGQLAGVIWATENLGHTGFYDRIRQMETNSYAAIGLGLFLGLGGALALMHGFVRSVEKIKDGLKVLEQDLNRPLPPAPGELGEITRAINRLASRLVDVHQYYQIMLATIDDAMLVVDVLGRVIIANAAAGRLFALPEDYAYKHYRETFPPGSPFPELISRALEEKRQYKDLKLSRPREQGDLDLLVSTATLLDSSGRTVGAALYCRDVTERLRLEEKMHRQERLAALGKLVAGVAHEIRNPLTSISCYIQLWQKTNNPSPRALATMYREVTRLENLIEQLLYFTRPAEAKFAPRDLNQVVEKVLQFFREVYRTPVEVVTNLEPDLPPAWIDGEQIERVLMNIIYNALQAMPEGGRLTLETAFDRPSDSLVTTISDTGCGIAPEHMKHLFDPFFSTREKGTGLGLAIAHEIIQAHGGNIEVESHVGRGTTFRIYLQVRKEETHGQTGTGSG